MTYTVLRVPIQFRSVLTNPGIPSAITIVGGAGMAYGIFALPELSSLVATDPHAYVQYTFDTEFEARKWITYEIEYRTQETEALRKEDENSTRRVKKQIARNEAAQVLLRALAEADKRRNEKQGAI